MLGFLFEFSFYRKLNKSSIVSKIIISILFIGLVSLGIYLRNENIESSKEKITSEELKEIYNEVKLFRSKNQRLPNNINELIGNNPNKRHLIEDCYGNEYCFTKSDSLKGSFEISSSGIDGIPKTKDDIYLNENQ
jgi:hypothetical protein